MSENIDWKSVEAAYRAGMPVAEIRRKFAVPLGELFKRIRAEGWERPDIDGPPPDGPPSDNGESERLPALLDETASEAISDAVDEAVTDVINSHKRITGRLREQFDRELAELQAMRNYLASFLDERHIEKLKAKQDGGKALEAYLNRAQVHSLMRLDMLSRLVQTGTRIVDLERTVWNLNAAGGGEEAATTYDDMLEELQKPIEVQELPPNVLRFEETWKRRDRGEPDRPFPPSL